MAKTAYFDNAATTFPKPEEVYVAMDEQYRNYGVNVGRGQHKLAAYANSVMEETRTLILDLFHAKNKHVVFTSTATEALNLLLNNVVKSGLNVYISPFEHNAVTRVLYHLKEGVDFNLFTLPFDVGSWEYKFDSILQLFADYPPHLMIITHVSNVCGYVSPIYRLCELSKQYGATNVIDMCQSAGLIDTDLSSDYFDFAVFDGHKTLYGPFGIAGIIGKSMSSFAPIVYGGTGIESANQSMPLDAPSRFEAGSHNILSIYGLNAALKWINHIGIDSIYSKEKANHERLMELLSKYSNINIVSPITKEKSTGIVSCIFDGYSSDNIGNILSQNDVAVRTGLHCAPLAHKTLDTYPAGTVRFSVSYFTDDYDFEQLEQVLDYIEENS